jgi:DNA polymerase-1
MKKVLLIDLSNLFFRTFYAVPQHFTMKNGTPSNALYGVISVIFSLFDSEHPSFIFAARDLKGETFRHKQMEGYKSGRPKMPEDLAVQLPYIFDFFTDVLRLPLLGKETFEADDIIATVSEKFRGESDIEVLILSADQDLLQLVGENVYVLSPKKGSKLLHKIDAAMVQKKLGVFPHCVPDYKAIAGDSSDRLVGVPGIGPIGTQKILGQFGTLENALENRGKILGKPGRLLGEYENQALLTKKMTVLYRNLDIPEYSKEKGKVPEEMPEGLIPFLQKISSRNLITWAERIFHSPLSAQQARLF